MHGVSRVIAVCRWDLLQGLHNRFIQVFAVACVIGGSALLAAAPGPDTLPLILIQALLSVASLFGFLIGWGTGQQAREQGAFLFSQPVSAGELVLGKLLGTGTWCLVLLGLFIAPAAVQAGMPETILVLGSLATGYVLVCVLAGLVIGLIMAPVSGLLAVLLTWVSMVAGWELVLLLLSQAQWMQASPGVFVTLLLGNPAGTFRIAAMVGLEAVPFDTAEIETGRFLFEHIKTVAGGIFAAWLGIIHLGGAWLLGRQEF
jgi:hypothetical protein